MIHRNLVLLGIFVLSLLLGAGVWGWLTLFGPSGPKIRDLAVTPETFRFAGGHARVRAEVTDDQGVAQVTAVLSEKDTQVLSIVLVNTSGDAERPVYWGEFQVPANIRRDGEPVEYTVRILALDAEGLESEEQKTIKVPAPSMPPAPPD